MTISTSNGERAVFRSGPARNVLMLADYHPGNASVIGDFLYAFDRYSRHRYYYAMWPRRLESSFDFSAFDVVVIFWSIYFPPPSGIPPSLPPALAEKLRRSSALKVLFRQDEHAHIDRLHTAMEEAGIDVMFTCVAERDHEKFYPATKVPSLRGVHTVLTGYVPEYLESPSCRRARHPQYDIGYRSRVVPYTLGDLGREKFVICEQFSHLGPAHGFSVNLSVREEDRLYGRDWLRFLRSTRFQLGTPSGASVIDFTGEIAAATAAFLEKHPGAPYDEVRRRFFADVDGRLVIDTISPRLFEYTATGNVMILRAGHYGGLLEPDVHYIPVANNYSNSAEVFAKMRDRSYCEQLHRNAHQHLIGSGAFSYRAFAKRFDATLDAYLPATVTRTPISRAGFYARRVAHSRQYVIPVKGTEMTLPLHGGLGYWCRSGLDALSANIPFLGARFRRRGGSAYAHLRRGVVILGAVLSSRALRKALWQCVINGKLRSDVVYYDLLRELGWLAALGAEQGRRTFVVPRFDRETGRLRLCQLELAVRPRTFERLKRGDYRAALDAIGALPQAGEPLQISVELARGEHGVTIRSMGMCTYTARTCAEGFRLIQFARFLREDRQRALCLLRALVQPREPQRQALPSLGSMPDLRAKVEAAIEVVRHRGGWQSLCAYWWNPRLRSSASLRQYAREIWLWTAIGQVQKAQAYGSNTFWLEARFDGDVLVLVSRPGISPGGTPQQRELIELAWACAHDGTLERVEWDHRALGETFSWQIPGQPWRSVRLGPYGVSTFHAAIHWDGWWELIGEILHLGALTPPSHTRRLRALFERRRAELRILANIVRTAPGLRMLWWLITDHRTRTRTSFAQAVREIWLWTALASVQAARAFVQQPFWLQASIEGPVLRLVSQRGVSPGGTPQQRELIELAWACARDGTLERVEWDHRALGETFSWQIPGQPWQSVRLGPCGVETFRTFLLSGVWWNLVARTLLSGTPVLPPVRTPYAAWRTRLGVLAEVAGSIHGLRALATYWCSRRIRARAGLRQFVRELWLWIALTRVQRTCAQTPERFWIESSIDGNLVRLVSHRGAPPKADAPRRYLAHACTARTRAEQAIRFEWDHRAVGEVLTWQRPGRSLRSVRLQQAGIEVFQALPLLPWLWENAWDWSLSPHVAESGVGADALHAQPDGGQNSHALTVEGCDRPRRSSRVVSSAPPGQVALAERITR